MDHKKRKDVYDEFISKTHYIAPVIEKRFSLIKSVYKDLGQSRGLDPISSYLEHENVSYEQLAEFVKSMGQRAKKPFREALDDVSKTILNRQAEYYDDFYFFRNMVYSDIDSKFSGIDPVGEVKRTLANMDFDLGKIVFDTEDRKKNIHHQYASLCAFLMIYVSSIRGKVLFSTFKLVSTKLGMLYMLAQSIQIRSIGINTGYRWE